LGCPRSWFVFYRKPPRFPNSSYYELGSSYPNATGHNAGNDEAMPLEGDLHFRAYNLISQRLCFQSAETCSLWFWVTLRSLMTIHWSPNMSVLAMSSSPICSPISTDGPSQPMDWIPHRRSPHSRESNQYRWFCGGSCQPNQSSH
jgi:hypothetical protein